MGCGAITPQANMSINMAKNRGIENGTYVDKV